MTQKKFMTLGIFGFIILIALIIFSNATFVTIDAGERGVLFYRFGGGLDKENIYQPGFHIVAPWNTMYVYEVREQQLEEEMEVLSSNGLNIKVDVTARIRPNYGQIGEIHETFGRDYMTRLIRPEVRSSVRQVIGKFTPEELYSTKRDEVQTLITEDLSSKLSENFIDLRAILIRDIELPDKVRMAIEEKLEAEQSALKYEYILQRETQEAERRLIEAQAKADANRILNASLSDKILQDKGIEATLELAQSPNSKVIVVGGEGGGLPLILGGGN
ncbi:prohibitin family protein [Lewinella sp. W8]|uniref:prohibitin family protein n=1 Tax=Lewinella sp. W8 TaxID=2528208 RepID=UPI001068723A|nr:prohibitin family protein [Lewinella sp. W8]MTB50593.1 prohibitin family protein [Lewinella sp. W8]